MQKETIENYCKVISQLCKKDGARSVDVANELSISKISVSITLHKLKEEEYIQMQPYGRIKLTQKGECIAKEVSQKHKKIQNFLQICLKVEERKAKQEACAIEHYLSEDTINKMLETCKKCKCE